MKIRTQLFAGAALFGVVLLVIAASMVATTAELGRLERQVQLADRIGIGANDLSYLADEYLLYGEPQQAERWNARYAALGDDLANLSARTPARQALVAAITEDRLRLRSVFDGVVAERGSGPADPATLPVSWSRVGVQTQGLAYDAARLAALLHDETHRLATVNSLLIAALLGAFAVALLTNYLVVGRRTLQSIENVLAGAKVVGSGDLDHAIPVTGDDEVGELSRAFNRMTADLRTVTASRAELERAERMVREREQALQSIFRAAPVGIGISSRRVIRSANEHLCTMTGYAPEELLGRDARVLYASDKEYARVGVERDAQILESGTGAAETRWRRKDGTTMDVLLSWSPMDPSAPGEDVVFVALDITDLHEKEAALRESEAKYRNAVELSPDAILIHQDGRIVFANPAAAVLFGAGGPEALLGRPVLDLVHPDTRELAAANVELDLRGEESPLTAIELLRDDGTTVSAQGRGAAIPFGGRPAVQVVLRDVTEERRTEEDLRKTRDYLDSLIDHANAPIIVWDPAFRITRFNAAFEHLSGYAADEVLGRNLAVLFPEESREESLGKIRRTVSGQWRSVEIPILRRDGGVRIALWNSANIYDRAGTTLVATIAQGQDITERIRGEEALREYAENLRRSNEDLERFAYVSSHDLQEPLRSIVSFSQLLERRYRGQLGQDADEYIDFIVEGGNRMQALILDLLAYSRVNTKRQELRPTDTGEVLAAVERNLALQLNEAGAVLTHDPLPAVLADPLQLEQVLMNLVSNALKFHRPDEPLRIHVGARRLDGFWEFSVQDNGIGIEKEYFDRIFVIFQRLHTKETYPGTGIGLAIVKRIVDRHGGAVRVESRPGEGTTFLFTLPAASDAGTRGSREGRR